MSPWPDANETTFAIATPEERALVCDVLARTKSPIYLEALDLVPDRFDLAQISEVWKNEGILRKREVLVARTAEGPAVAAIVELVGEGVHLFGLLDSVRIVALRDEVLPNELLVQLLDFVREYYKAHDKALFTYHFEGSEGRNDMGHALDAGFQDMGGTFLILLRWELVPELLEQIYQIAAPRDLPPLPHTAP